MNKVNKLLVGCVLSVWLLPVHAADVDSREALEDQLAHAQQRLEQAAAQIAELSRKMSAGDAMQVVTRLHRGKRKALLGVRIDDASESTDGVLIESVSEGGPAAAEDVQSGDVIVAINGRSLDADHSVSILLEELTALAPGDAVRLQIDRAGSILEKVVTTSSFEDAFPGQAAKDVRAFAFSERGIEELIESFVNDADIDIDIEISEEQLEKLKSIPGKFEESFHSLDVGPMITMLGGYARGIPNFKMTEVSPDLGAYFGVDGGVLITEVPDNGRDFGLRAGDVVRSIDGEAVTTQRAVRGFFQRAEPNAILNIELVRQGETLRVDVRVPDPFDGESWQCEESADGKQRKCIGGADKKKFSFSYSTDDDE